MSSGFDTRVVGTARASCRGAGGRFESRAVDVDFVLPGIVSDSEAQAAAAQQAMADIGEQCYSFSWLSLSITQVQSQASGQTMNVRAKVYFDCPSRPGAGREQIREYVENVPVDFTRDETDRTIEAWAQSLIDEDESDLEGCVFDRIVYIAPLYWPMSGGIG